ncbi:MAG: FAD:protein FMN transferase [Deltaproteobacteria bacterium]|nr:FAD:protein FMN transferase [Deltaproteobacteria bacterium]
MGTTYHVTVITPLFKNPAYLKKKITQRLDDINQSMSTYIKNSEISKFNHNTDTSQKHFVSPDLFYVMSIARDLYQLTYGAWDGTVKPLIDLWGFGTSDRKQKIPDKKKITEMLQTIGFNQVIISTDGYLLKKAPSITIDLASIAKGYAVDQVSALIRSNGISDFIVEIGGEVYASGIKKNGKPWRVGINAPRQDAAFDLVYQAVALRDSAMATSGDYRNFFEINGIRYSHILDPRTGYPVKNGVVSVSILSSSCTFADGLATAIMVLGPKAGIELVERLNDTECLIITQNKDGSFTDAYSKGFNH